MPDIIYTPLNVPNVTNVVVDLKQITLLPDSDTIRVNLSGLNELNTPATNFRISFFASDTLPAGLMTLSIVLPKISTLNYRNASYILDCTSESIDMLAFYVSGYVETIEGIQTIEEINNYAQSQFFPQSKLAILDLLTPTTWTMDQPIIPIK